MPTTLRMGRELEERYSRLADSTGRSRTFYYKKALEGAIDQLEYEYGILRQVEDYRAGKLDTYSLEEVKAHLGMDD